MTKIDKKGAGIMLVEESMLKVGKCFLHHNAGVKIVKIDNQETTVVCILERTTGNNPKKFILTQVYQKTVDGYIDMPCCNGF